VKVELRKIDMQRYSCAWNVTGLAAMLKTVQTPEIVERHANN